MNCNMRSSTVLTAMSELIPQEEIPASLTKCPAWELEGKALMRTIEFESFNEAIDFVNKLAEMAEDAGHHPDIAIRYVKVTLRLTTHDKGGVTDADLEMAQRIDNFTD